MVSRWGQQCTWCSVPPTARLQTCKACNQADSFVFFFFFFLINHQVSTTWSPSQKTNARFSFVSHRTKDNKEKSSPGWFLFFCGKDQAFFFFFLNDHQGNLLSFLGKGPTCMDQTWYMDLVDQMAATLLSFWLDLFFMEDGWIWRLSAKPRLLLSSDNGWQALLLLVRDWIKIKEKNRVSHNHPQHKEKKKLTNHYKNIPFNT